MLRVSIDFSLKEENLVSMQEERLYLQQVQQASTDDAQVSPLQSLGVVHGRELKAQHI